ncbi:MAG: LysR family transcriptional regulator [Slackia sp.]|nr:LysR family transcriptional regulator [Slackia sp.]
MNLAQLRYFQKLADLQHYSKAAKELNIAQPSLSSSISSLEKELGIPLFQKVGRNVRLTKYGHEFLGYVNESLERIDTGIAMMHEYAGAGAGGHIDVGCIMTVQARHVPRIIKEFKRDISQDTCFDIKEEPSGPLLESLKQDVYDVAFLAKGGDDESIAYVPVIAQKVVVSVNEHSPLASREFVTLEDLHDYDLISYKTAIPLGKAIHDLLKKARIESVSYSYRDENILAGFAATENKPAIMLDTVYAPSIDGLIVKELYDDAEHKNSFYHRVYFAYDAKKRHPHCVDRFIEFVTAQYELKDTADRTIFID